MVNFMRQENKLRIEIRLDAVQRARLAMSAKAARGGHVR